MASKAKDTDKSRELVFRVHEFVKNAAEHESEGRRERLDDVKFVRLGEQWPDYARRGREIPGQERPMLTVNRLQQFRNQVINEIRQNKEGMRVRPFDDNGDPEVADIIQGIIRHIEDVSSADIAYDTAAEWQVDCGLGYFRVITDYVSDDSWDQEILIKPIHDIFKVYFDPKSTCPTGSDAKRAAIVTEMTREEFKAKYPDCEENDFPLSGEGDSEGWLGEQTVRIAEYFEIEEKKDNLLLFDDGQTIWESDLNDPNTVTPKPEGEIVKSRKSSRKYCKWYKIGGGKVLDESVMMTQFIPIIKVVGNVSWIEGKEHIHGLIRFGKDPQRMYNYWLSSETECLALQSKAPFIGPEGSFEGHESAWKAANKVPMPYLEYKPVIIGGNPMPMPVRQSFAPPPSGLVEAKAHAVEDMKASMGIYDPGLATNPEQQSGKAILSLQRQASQGTFHYSDNLGRSLRHCARIVMELMRSVYDTARIARVIGVDGSDESVLLDPNLGKPVHEEVLENGKTKKIYNIMVGRYDVVADSGPSYATKRQEAAASMQALVQAYPMIMQIAGDLLVKNLDWPGAEEISERLKATLPPPVLAQIEQEKAGGEGGPDAQANPLLDQAQQQMEQMAGQMEHMAEMIKELQSKENIEREKLDLEWFKAKTERMAKIPAPSGPDEYKDAELYQRSLDAEFARDMQMLKALREDEEFEQRMMMQQQAQAAQMQQPTQGPQQGPHPEPEGDELTNPETPAEEAVE